MTTLKVVLHSLRSITSDKYVNVINMKAPSIDSVTSYSAINSKMIVITISTQNTVRVGHALY